MRASARILALALAALLFASLPAALADPKGESQGAFDDPSSPAAREIKVLYDWMTIAALLVGFGVQGFIMYTLWRYRAKPGDEAEGSDLEEDHTELHRKEDDKPSSVLHPGHHGDVRVEIGYTAVTLVVFLLIGYISAVSLTAIETPHAPIDLEVEVTGHQWFWEFHYPGPNITDSGAVSEMHVPVNQVVGLTITSVDVLHAVWIPNLGVKIDAVPGHENHFWFKAEKEGRFLLQCAEYCAGAHSNMHGVVVVESQPTFDAWVVAKQIAARPPPPIPEVSAGQFNVTLTAAGPDPPAINFVQGANVSLRVHNDLSVPAALNFSAPYDTATMADVPAGGDGWLNITFSTAAVRGAYSCTAGCAAAGVFNVSVGARVIDISLRDFGSTPSGYAISPAEITAHPGEVLQFRVKNEGAIDHNFSVLGSYQFYVPGLAGASTLKPGETILSDRFVVGSQGATYVCSVTSHDISGMKGELKVEGAPPPTGGHGTPAETVPGFEGAFAALSLVGVASVAALARRRQ